MPVLHRPEVVSIAVKSYIEKHAICLKDYRIKPFLSIRHAHGDLCKHLGIDSSTHCVQHMLLIFFSIFFLLSILGEWLCFCVALTILTFVIVSIKLVRILNWNLRILRNNIACEFFLLIKFSSINSINSLIPWSSVFVT